MKTSVELRTELQTLLSQTKALDTKLRAKSETTAEDAEKYNRMIDDGMKKREEFDAAVKAEKFLASDVDLNRPADSQKAVESIIGGRKSAGQIVLASPQKKAANKEHGMDRVAVPTLLRALKALYNVTATVTEPILAGTDEGNLADMIALARQRPPSVIDLVRHRPTSFPAVEYVLFTGRNGAVTGVTITAQGSGYTAASTVTFGAAPAGGRTATGTPIVVAGAITGVTMTDSGAGYVTPPSVTFAVAGSGATGTAVLGGADVVPEYSGGIYGLKPSGDLQFDLKIALIKTIAEWVPVSKQILDDTSGALQDVIDTDLTYQLRVKLEDQIIGGDGTGNNFLGILNTTGIQTRVMSTSAPSGRGQGNTTATANTILDTIRRGVTDLRLTFYEPDGIVVNPGDGESMELLKDSQGRYVQMYDTVAMRVWRIPVVETAAMTALTGLVGNFALGATLWDRQESEILIGQPNDMFLRNAFAVLAELRAGFAVQRPLAFEKMTFIANQ